MSVGLVVFSNIIYLFINSFIIIIYDIIFDRISYYLYILGCNYYFIKLWLKQGTQEQCQMYTTKYGIPERSLMVAIEDAKQRLQAISHRLKRYTARCDQYQ